MHMRTKELITTSFKDLNFSYLDRNIFAKYMTEEIRTTVETETWFSYINFKKATIYPHTTSQPYDS